MFPREQKLPAPGPEVEGAVLRRSADDMSGAPVTSPAAIDVAGLLALQRLAGNRAAASLLRSRQDHTVQRQDPDAVVDVDILDTADMRAHSDFIDNRVYQVAFGLLPQFLIYVGGLDRPIRLTSPYVDQHVAAVHAVSRDLFPRMSEAERFVASHRTRGSGRPVAYYWGPGHIIAPTLFCPATTPVTARLMREAVLAYADWAISVLTGDALGLGAGLGLRLAGDAAAAFVRASGRVRVRPDGEVIDDAADSTGPARRARDREARLRRRRDIARPRMTGGAGAERLPPERFRRFSQQVREDLRSAHDQAAARRGAERREAGAQYQNVVATDIRGGDVQEMFSRPHRRPDVGTGHEVTLEGQHGRFSTAKLDQFWLDLRDTGQILLTVPRLSDAAADQLRRLGAQAEDVLGVDVLIIVRETL